MPKLSAGKASDIGTNATAAQGLSALAAKAQARSKAARDAQAAWTPANLPGVVGWYRGDTLVAAGLADGSAIATWADKSAKANDLTQATGSKQPLLKTGANGINGQPVGRFSAAAFQQLVKSAPVGIPNRAGSGSFLNGFTILYVVRPTTNAAAAQVVSYSPSASPNGWELGFSGSSGNVQFALQGVFAGFSLARTMAAGTAHSVSAVVNSDFSVDLNMDFRNQNDGTGFFDKHLTTGAREVSGTLDTLAVGNGAWSTATNYLDGDLAELIIIDHALTVDEKEKWARYCAVRYNILVGSKRNAAAYIPIAAYDSAASYGGFASITEPTVVDFGPNGFGGFRWWAAAVQFPNSDSSFENPSIFVSNDKTTWSVPAGVTNPVVARPASGSNADPCLRYYNGKFYLWWIVNGAGAGAGVWYKTSTDGIAWSAAVQTNITVPAADTSATSVLEPKVVYDSSQALYVMFTSNSFVTPNVFSRRTATAPEGPWSTPMDIVLPIPGTQLNSTGVSTGAARAPFHFNVEIDTLGVYRLICCDNDTFRNFWAASSGDGIAWVFSPYPLMTPSVAGFDSNTMYRAVWTMPVDGDGLTYDCWYSAASGSAPVIHRIAYTTLLASVFP